MQRITSFSVDHDFIVPGIYVSRIDGDVTTYDLRTRKPNCGDYMDNLTMHSVEHMMATFLRNSELRDDIIYFGQLNRNDISRIADIELKPLAERVKALGYSLRLTSKTMNSIICKGYDRRYGARPLRRAIQSLVEDPLLETILDGRADDKDITIFGC